MRNGLSLWRRTRTEQSQVCRDGSNFRCWIGVPVAPSRENRTTVETWYVYTSVQRKGIHAGMLNGQDPCLDACIDTAVHCQCRTGLRLSGTSLGLGVRVWPRCARVKRMRDVDVRTARLLKVRHSIP